MSRKASFVVLVVFLSFMGVQSTAMEARDSVALRCVQSYKKLMSVMGDQKDHCFRLQVSNEYSNRKQSEAAEHTKSLSM